MEYSISRPAVIAVDSIRPSSQGEWGDAGDRCQLPNVRTRSLNRILGVLPAAALALTATAATAQQAIDTPRGPGFLIYGNYCGPGNRGPAHRPIDALDAACMHHDAAGRTIRP